MPDYWQKITSAGFLCKKTFCYSNLCSLEGCGGEFFRLLFVDSSIGFPWAICIF